MQKDESINRFPYTTEGYQDAKKFLEQIGMWEKVSKGGLSTDGWSIIHEANSIWKRVSKSRQRIILQLFENQK